jgi:saccharopine dehydrogenase-like NADP-dependent oxidoreductase
MPGRIVIVGGYGAFGARAAERLVRLEGSSVVIAGRSLEKAARQVSALRPRARVEVSPAALDARAATAEELRALDTAVVINASGPFQQHDYTLARACIGAGAHYVDLADDRRFVCDITRLDADAKAAGVTVVSGASSVPGVSSAALARLAAKLARVDEVHIGISPGNSFDPGIATAASIIGQAGQPLITWQDGAWITRYGWQDLHRHAFQGLGRRWMCRVDVPDLELVPRRRPDVATVTFSAGLEVGMFHLGLWSLTWLVRAGLVHNLDALAAPMLAVKRRLSAFGSDAGGMFVRVAGRDETGRRDTLEWTLVARSGDGPYVPAIASVILARRLVQGAGPQPGATPCFGLFPLTDFEAEVADLDITCSETRQRD